MFSPSRSYNRISVSTLKGIAVTFAVLHLSLISLSSAKTPVGKLIQNRYFLEMVDLYSFVSGAGYHYGFFAPGVSSQLRVLYTAKSNGRVISEGPFQSHNIETTFRIHNMLEYLWETQSKPELRRSIAASLAGRILGEFQDADTVEIDVDALVLPSSVETSRGAAPRWESYYSATFKRSELVQK